MTSHLPWWTLTLTPAADWMCCRVPRSKSGLVLAVGWLPLPEPVDQDPLVTAWALWAHADFVQVRRRHARC